MADRSPTWRSLVRRARRVRKMLSPSTRVTAKSAARLESKVDRLVALVEAMTERQKQEDKWRRRVRRQMDALMRREFLNHAELPVPESIIRRRFVLYSQNEEDGIALALLSRAGVIARRFVEIGCGAKGGNSAILACELGWSGLMIDANPLLLEGLRSVLGVPPSVIVSCATVSSANINEILERHGMTGDVDLLSIDIDSTDYWVLAALEACRPRLLVMEYNALFGPTRAVTLPDTPIPGKRPKGYFGASLAALEKLARRKGYGLVLCEPAGVNAFFLRDDLAPDIPRLAPADAYRAPLDRRALLEPERKAIDIYGVIDAHRLPLVEV